MVIAIAAPDISTWLELEGPVEFCVFHVFGASPEMTGMQVSQLEQ